MKNEGSLNTIVGKGSSLTGDLDIQGSIRIDGVVKGEVKCSELLTVGSSGRIIGSVKAKQFILAGTVNGNITATERAELNAKSVVEGDIQTKSLIVESGAVFHGQCSMKDGAPRKTEAPAVNNSDR